MNDMVFRALGHFFLDQLSTRDSFRHIRRLPPIKHLKNTGKIKMRKSLVALVIVTVGVASSAYSESILEYKFDDNADGNTSVSTGSDTAAVTFFTSNGEATNLHGSAGSGVSGQAGDLAFDNSASSAMGISGAGGSANSGNISALNGLSSFTLQGWFNTSGSGTVSGARLFEKNGGAGNDLSLQYSRNVASGQLVLYLGTPTATAITGVSSGIDATLGTSNSWVFFAVTYDGTLAENNVKFYTGNPSSGVTQVGTTLTLNSGTLSAANAGALALGNIASGGDRPWHGLLDNMRIYGATSGNAGVLTMSQLEALRAADAAIP